MMDVQLQFNDGPVRVNRLKRSRLRRQSDSNLTIDSAPGLGSSTNLTANLAANNGNATSNNFSTTVSSPLHSSSYQTTVVRQSSSIRPSINATSTRTTLSKTRPFSVSSSTATYSDSKSGTNLFDLASYTALASSSTFEGFPAFTSATVTASPTVTPMSSDANSQATADSALVSATSTGLSIKSKAAIGGVLGGLGGLGLLSALVFLLFVRRRGTRRAVTASYNDLVTPQRTQGPRVMIANETTPIRSGMLGTFETGHGATRTAVLAPGLATREVQTSSSGTTFADRARATLFARTRKSSEPPSPTTNTGFQVISGRRLSSPPTIERSNSQDPFQDSPVMPIASPRHSPLTSANTPQMNRLGSTPTFYRVHRQDGVGRSQADNGSGISHVSRFVEGLD